jgi:signal transduction histidine kinase
MIKDARFNISATVIRQLGDQLISDEVTALLELIKNAFDADATYAKVNVVTEGMYSGASLHFPMTKDGTINIPEDATEDEKRRLGGVVPPGYIEVVDDGTGMDRDDIDRGWLTISFSQKRGMKEEGLTTPKRNRTPLGNKGLGRLSTQRLGRRLEMFTVKETLDPHTMTWELSDERHHVAVNWDSFHDAVLLSNVPVSVESTPRERNQLGTQLVITGLRDAGVWLGDAQKALVSRITQLISPFQAERPFRVSLTINGHQIDFEELTRLIRNVALSTHEFVFDGDKLHLEGRIRLDVLSGGNDPQKQDEYQQLITSDGGLGFFEYLRDSGMPIPGLSYIPGHEWFVGYNVSLDSRSLALETRNGKVVSPGPFMGEIDQFGYVGVELGDARSVFDRVSDYKSYLRDQSGVRVYRDGFGVRPYGLEENDWLGFGSDQTSGRSFYGLRPKNIIGYVGITSRDNPALEEKTDREGFTETPASQNFLSLATFVRKTINDVFNSLRRGYNAYRKVRQDELKNFFSEEDLFDNIRAAKQGSDALATATSNVQIDVLSEAVGTAIKRAEGNSNTGAEVPALLQDVKNELVRVEKVIEQARSISERASKLDQAADYLEAQMEVLRNQLADFSELAGLGITAEALSHELENLIDRLFIETNQVIQALKHRNIVVAEVTTYTRYVRGAVSSLRKQLSHLSPSLRYVREERAVIHTRPFLEKTADYYRARRRFRVGDMHFELATPFDDFSFRMNTGKFTQVIDNLVLNSEYWLDQAVKQGIVRHPTVTVSSRAPHVQVFDNGLGVDAAVAPMLFQPFVTTKPSGAGRGLGLFITRQLLDAEGCRIQLLPDLNEHGRRYIFQVDLTGALHDGTR